MAKRGRKPSANKKGYYFGEEEEQAFVDYLTTESVEEKNEIFNTKLRPVFTKMTESIIRRYNLYPPDEDFDTTFNDTLSFLISKIQNYRIGSGYKAYSYCGTIIKNYLIYKVNQYSKNQKRNTSYDAYNTEELTSITDAMKYSYDDSTTRIAFLTELMGRIAGEIEGLINDKENNVLTDNQIIVGKALIYILTHWEEIMENDASYKFNKSSILLYLKEATGLGTEDIRDAMRGYRSLYFIMKNELMEEDF